MEKIKQFIEETAESLQTQWNLEGFTIAVVKDGETIFTKGYGKRNAEADPQTERHISVYKWI